MENCGLEKISREDLQGLENTRSINVSRNQLKTLPDDLFADMKKLSFINFEGNQLKRLSSRFLLPIRHTLQFASFENNTKINEVFDKKSKDHND